MADIPTTQAIAWEWIEYPWPLPSGTRPGNPIVVPAHQRRRELRALVLSELQQAGFVVHGPYGGRFDIFFDADPLTRHFTGEFVAMCRFATRYLTEEGNS